MEIDLPTSGLTASLTKRIENILIVYLPAKNYQHVAAPERNLHVGSNQNLEFPQPIQNLGYPPIAPSFYPPVPGNDYPAPAYPSNYPPMSGGYPPAYSDPAQNYPPVAAYAPQSYAPSPYPPQAVQSTPQGVAQPVLVQKTMQVLQADGTTKEMVCWVPA